MQNIAFTFKSRCNAEYWIEYCPTIDLTKTCFLHFRYFSHRHTWEDAEKDCREQSAHLSSITSVTEQEFINGLGHDNAWIGLNDRTVEEDFQWTDANDLVTFYISLCQ
jgi:hypothetical protein